MNWAWRQALTPTLKLVLMALADAADDHGVCCPSVSTLAEKCTVYDAYRTTIAAGLDRPTTANRRTPSASRWVVDLEPLSSAD
jgi:hypothetical protein